MSYCLDFCGAKYVFKNFKIPLTTNKAIRTKDVCLGTEMLPTGKKHFQNTKKQHLKINQCLIDYSYKQNVVLVIRN